MPLSLATRGYTLSVSSHSKYVQGGQGGGAWCQTACVQGGGEEGRGVTLHVCRGAGRRGVVSHCMCAGGQGGGAWCHTACAHLQVEMDDQGLPTNNLTLEARSECQRVGSNAETVDAIIDGSGDAAVLKMIKNGIDRVNARATTKSQKVPAQSVCVCVRLCVGEGGSDVACLPGAAVDGPGRRLQCCWRRAE